MTRPTPQRGNQLAGFSHHGPGGDDALARELPGLVTTLQALPPDGPGVVIGGQLVARQQDRRWRVGHDVNLASPWVVVQSIRSAQQPATQLVSAER